MNQNDFNNMTVDRLETLITCQRESTELEIMLVKRMLEITSEVERAERSEGEADVEIDHLKIALEEIESEATDPDDKDEALKEIIRLCGNN